MVVSKKPEVTGLVSQHIKRVWHVLSLFVYTYIVVVKAFLFESVWTPNYNVSFGFAIILNGFFR